MAVTRLNCIVILFLLMLIGCGTSKEAKLENLNNQIKSEPLNPENYYERAKLLFPTGDKENSLKDINTAVRLDSVNVKYLTLRSAMYGELDQFEKAISDYRKLLNYNKAMAAVYYQQMNRFFIYLGIEDSASVYAEKALESGLVKENFLLNNVHSYEHIGNYNKAISSAGELIRITHDDKMKLEYLKLREFLEMKNHDYRAAMDDDFKLLELVQDESSDHSIFNYNIALCYRGLGVTDSARDYWVKAKNFDDKMEYSILGNTVSVDMSRKELSRSLDSLEDIKYKIRLKYMDRLSFLTFLPEMKMITAVCFQDSFYTIKFWSAENGKLVKSIPLPVNESISLFTVDREEKYFVICTNENFTNDSIKCYSLGEEKWLWKKKLFYDKVLCTNIAFTDDDKQIIVITNTLILKFDAQSGEMLSEQDDFFKGFHPSMTTPAFKYLSEDGKYLFVWQADYIYEEGGEWLLKPLGWLIDLFGGKSPYKKMKFWDVSNNKLLCEVDKPEGIECCTGAAFSSDSRTILMGSNNGYYRLFSFLDCRLIREWKLKRTESEIAIINRFKTDTQNWKWIDYSPFISISPDTTVYAIIKSVSFDIWNYKTDSLIKSFGDPNMTGRSEDRKKPMRFSADGKYFAFEMKGRLFLYETKGWKEIWNVPSLASPDPVIK